MPRTSPGPMMPSVKRNPAASSKSWPGVRMVTATFRCSPPGSSTRISMGSSVASRSERRWRSPPSTFSTRTRLVLVGRSAVSRRSPASSTGSSTGRLGCPVLDVLEPEPALHAQVAVRDRMVERRRHLDDIVVLHVQLEAASDAAVRADRLGDRLGGLVPRARLAQVVLALEHERARGADGDAVAAVDACRVGQRRCELGGDAGVEPAAGDGDRERVLPVGAAALHALVAEDALRVVADVVLVVDLDRLGDRCGRLPVAGVMVAGLGAVAGACRGGRRGRAVPLGPRLVLRRPALGVGGGREVDARAEELEHHLPAVAHPLAVGADDHAVLGLPRARRHEHPRALELDHAHPACVHRGERLAEAERRDVERLHLAGVEDRRALGHAHGLAVDLELDGAADRHRDCAHATSSGVKTPRTRIAESIALAAVCPRPQIDASRMATAISSSRATSSATVPRGRSDARRRSASCCRTVPTRHGTHWPQLSSRKKAAIRSRIGTRSTASSKTMTTPEPSVAPAARVASNESSRSSESGPTNPPAAPPSSTARSVPPPATPPAASSTSRSVTPNGASYRPGRSTQPDRHSRRVPVDCSVPICANAAPPSSTMSSTLIRLSTLLTTVGLPNRPTSTGNGGLLRGSPRSPSIELN